MLDFEQPIVVEIVEDLSMQRHRDGRGRRLAGPGENLGDGRGTSGDPGLLQQHPQAGVASGLDGGGAAGSSGQCQGGRSGEQIVEAGRVARHQAMQHFLHLTAQTGVLADQVAAVPDEQLQLLVVVGPDRSDQAEAADRRAEDARQIGVVGLVARIGRLPIVPAGVRMDQACVETGLAKGVLHGPMVRAGLLDGDDEVREPVFDDGRADAMERRLKIALRVRARRGRDQNVAIEVGEEELRAQLGAVEGDDTKSLRSDPLHSRVDLTIRLVNSKHPTHLLA